MTPEERVEALKLDVNAELKSLRIANQEEWQALRIGKFAERPKYLHHYTTADGLLGILKSKQIYATNSRFLNDYSEGLFGLSIAKEAIFDLTKTTKHFFEQTFLATAQTKLSGGDTTEQIYVACFCETRDLLSQWRGYGANGGYSADFATSEMFTPRGLRGGELIKVLYEPKLQNRLVRSLIERYLEAFRAVFKLAEGNFSLVVRLDGPPHPALVQTETIVAALLNDLVYLSTFLKSPTFKEECEWRLVIDPTQPQFDKLQFRSLRGLVVPYIEIPIQTGQSALVSITCGPSPHGVLASRSVRVLLRELGLERVEVFGSEIPLKV